LRELAKNGDLALEEKKLVLEAGIRQMLIPKIHKTKKMQL